MQNTPDRDHPPGQPEATGAHDVPPISVIPHNALWHSPDLLPVTGQRYTVGWQDSKKHGPCFLIARTGITHDKIVDRFPLTQDGWYRAWATLVKLDGAAAQAVANTLQQQRVTGAAQIAETRHQAQVYKALAAAGDLTEFWALGVQVLAAEGTVYTIGESSAATKTDTSRLLGQLPGAKAVVTSPGLAMLLPIGFGRLATRTKADAVVVFADGTTHSEALDRSDEVREAQKEAVQFNALVGTSGPAAAERDSDPAVKLRKLQELRDAGLLTIREYEAKRAEVINLI